MIGRQRPYLSYLLRLWLVDDEGLSWRASLESPSTAERRGFTNLESLFTFLRAQAHDLAATAQWECEADAAAADVMPETAPDEQNDRYCGELISVGSSGGLSSHGEAEEQFARTGLPRVGGGDPS